MKKMKNLLIAGIMAFALTSCVISMPTAVTSNWDGESSKEGTASATFLFGAIPIGFDIDISTEAAARNGGIREIHSVNTTYKNYFIVSFVETTVKGQ